MLRVSIETAGGDVDVRGITDGDAAKESGIPGAEALVRFVEATLGGEADEVTEARDRVRAELGSAAVVDAAAVIGNFERMVRIADGTGIPLDQSAHVASESLQKELGLDAFEAASRTKAIAGWQRVIGKVLRPVVTQALRLRARQTKAPAK